MDQLTQLRARGLDEVWVAMSDLCDRHASEKIEVGLATCVEKPGPAPTHEVNGLTRVGTHDETVFKFL
jgi:hypothetical protein